MKKVFSVFVLLLVLSLLKVQAQKISVHPVKYMVSFDSGKNLYTAWVVPEYSTPNYNNPDTEEKGATAQFSLKVPKGFMLKDLQSIKGTWESSALNLASTELSKEIDPKYDYIVIGKSPFETNYGEFKEGEPVALFTFRGNLTNNQEKVKALESNDEFVSLASEKLSLNVAQSFYSRSGQSPKMNSVPEEQYKKQVSMVDVIKEMSQKLKADNLINSELSIESKVMVYPNPVSEEVNVKYFSSEAGTTANIYLVNIQGDVLQHFKNKTKLGFNTQLIKIGNLADGAYTIKTEVGGEIVSKKITKFQ